MAAGFPGPPLAKTLSLRDGQRVWFDGMPENVQDEIGEYALDLLFVSGPSEGPDAAHVFVSDRSALQARLSALREGMARDGHVWVSWPEGADGPGTELTEDSVREAGEALGFVDTKSCRVDAAWCGLKLVIRKDLR